LRNIPVIEVLPWKVDQVANWLESWRGLHDGTGPTLQELTDRKLDKLAETPILLFMIAQTWQARAGEESTSQAALYEEFFWQIAKGKHDEAREHHENISKASTKLRDQLIKNRLLDSSAQEPDAMLWLMGRVAWEATKREQRKFFNHGKEEALTQLDIENLLVSELDLRGASDTLQAIQVGLLLTLQAHLSAGKASRILFGHKTFREYLVARYWADRLKALARAHYRDWKGIMEPLLGGRLLSREDRTFEFLMETLNGGPLPKHPFSPFGLDSSDHRQLVAWAEEHFQLEEQVVPPRRPNALREDQQPFLREAALAIGSCLAKSPGMRIKDTLTARSMLAWFWLMRIGPIIIAPRAQWKGAVLTELNLRGADFRGADLEGAQFTRSELMLRRSGIHGACDFTEARLDKANFMGATCRSSRFVRASLKEATLEAADLMYSDFSSACLHKAFLLQASLDDSRLVGTDLSRATLTFSSLDRATLTGANLEGADLEAASLQEANLKGASLRNALLSGADLTKALLESADLTGALYNHETQWPEGFDPKAVGAIFTLE
jgi:uncharacterized protein YjbI with pentapeptide repeats